MENLNDLQEYEKSIQQDQKKNPLEETKFDFDAQSIKDKVIQTVSITSVLWVLLIGTIFYWYKQDIFSVIESTPTLEANLTILENNIEKQKSEMKALEDIHLNVSELISKEDILHKHLYQFDQYLYFKQMNDIRLIAKEVGLVLPSIQKIENKRDDKKLEDLDNKLYDLGISNFYEDVWYVTYLVQMTASEDIVMRFISKLQERVQFDISSLSMTRSPDGIQLGISIDGLYLIKEENE